MNYDYSTYKRMEFDIFKLNFQYHRF